MPAIPLETRARLVSLVGAETGVPPRLLEALAFKESSWIPSKRGGAGEVGLVQIKPATAVEVGFRGTIAELAEPLENLRRGAMYLAKQFRTFGTWGLALAAYNAGPGNVSRGYRGNLQTYVRPILERAGYMAKAAGGSGALLLALVLGLLTLAQLRRRR